MISRRRFCQLLAILLIFALWATHSHADLMRDFGAHVVHCKAMPTQSLDSTVATQLNIERTAERGVLNIAIMEKPTEGSMGKPTLGKVTAHWRDLNGMMGTISIREIREQNAVYYIGEFALPETTLITFDVLISVDETRPPYNFSFNQQFSR